MILSHKIRLEPNNKQRSYLSQAAGTARFVWNWALAEWDRQYKVGEKPKADELKKQFNQIKYQEFPWLGDIHRDAHSQPFADLQKAFGSFFKKITKRPRFKKKGVSRDSFYVANDKLRLNGKKVRLPKVGWIRLREPLRFEGKILSARVSREADRWFIAFQVDVGDYKKPRTQHKTTGVDLGITTAATLSDGEKIDGPKPLKRFLKRLQRLSRQHSRKQRGSNNRKKSALKLAKLHRKIKNIRQDFLHKLTSRLCRENQAVGIEDLNVAGMLRNKRLSRAISDVSFGEFRRQLDYKSEIYGTALVVANRWFPSSKTCSNCQQIKDSLSLSDRVYRCDSCGLEIDRDFNAAINLKPVAAGFAETKNARGPEGAGHRRETKVKPCRVEARTIHDPVRDQ